MDECQEPKLDVPARAPKHIYQALLAVIRADEGDELNQSRIDVLTNVERPTRNTDAKRFLDELGLITFTKRMFNDVEEARHDPRQFASLLKERLQRALISAECKTEELAFLDESDLLACHIKEQVDGLSLIERMRNSDQKSSRIDRIRGSLRTLCKVIIQTPDEATLEKYYKGRSNATTERSTTLQHVGQKVVEETFWNKSVAMSTRTDEQSHEMHIHFDRYPTSEDWLILSKYSEQEANWARQIEVAGENSKGTLNSK